MTFKVPEQHRIRGIREMPSNVGDKFGAFRVKSPFRKAILFIIANEACIESAGWEHVSVHASTSHLVTPSWEEMCYVKSLFWDETDTVVQFHPKGSDYVNIHKATLHLWRHFYQEFILPPLELV